MKILSENKRLIDIAIETIKDLHFNSIMMGSNFYEDKIKEIPNWDLYLPTRKIGIILENYSPNPSYYVSNSTKYIFEVKLEDNRPIIYVTEHSYPNEPKQTQREIST